MTGKFCCVLIPSFCSTNTPVDSNMVLEKQAEVALHIHSLLYNFFPFLKTQNRGEGNNLLLIH